MNSRTLILIFAVALLGVGLLMVLADLFAEPPVESKVTPAVAAVQIDPYTVITQDMIKAGDPVRGQDAFERGLYPVQSVVGLMSTSQILPGTQLNGVNAKPIEKVRFVQDLGLEIVSFQAGVDRTVGGELRPGHIVNLYGFGRDEETRQNFTELIESRLWVVKVSAGAGSVVSNATPRPDPDTGEYKVEGGDREQPTTLITVAVTPQQAFNIINALGARGLQAWATLAANQTANIARATPVATAAPPPTPGLPPDLALTATALWQTINATQPARAPRTGFGGAR